MPFSFPFGAGDGAALAGPHPDQVGFELGEGGEDVEKHLAHRIARVVHAASEGELDAARLELGRDGPGVGNGARQAVELGHDERVAVPHRRQGLSQTRPLPVRPGQAVVGVDTILRDAEIE